MVESFPGGVSGKESICHCRRCKRLGLDPWVRKIPWRRAWQPTPVFLPGESYQQRSLVGCRLWGRTESDTTEATQHNIKCSYCIHQQMRRASSKFHPLKICFFYIYYLDIRTLSYSYEKRISLNVRCVKEHIFIQNICFCFSIF